MRAPTGSAGPEGWLGRQRESGSAVVGVELTDSLVRLADVQPARRRLLAGSLALDRLAGLL